MHTQSIGFIGAGQMARALAAGFVRAGLVAPRHVLAADPVPAAGEAFQAAVPGARVLADNASVGREADLIFLATKPQQIATALADLDKATSGKLVISIAAGVKLAKLANVLTGARLVRVMPNTPCLVGQSASGYCLGPQATAADGERVNELLSAVGKAFEVEESLLDAVTGPVRLGAGVCLRDDRGAGRWRRADGLEARSRARRWPLKRCAGQRKWFWKPASTRPC